MCSIAGSANEKEVREMLKIQKHRSPDQSGYITRFGFTMGMGRLAIVDTKNKNLCPYEYEGNIICYNGEIYNYKELKKQLIGHGWKFETDSDTEVVLKSYLHWGTGCFDRFNGMFAIAIRENKTGDIILARDLAGEKPLYYNKLQRSFASEAKALASDIVDNDFFESLQHCFGQTLYKNVEEVLPGHYIKFSGIGNLNWVLAQDQVRWWNFIPKIINLKNPLEELDYLLNDAVKIRVPSEVKSGLYFSGGIDSSLISKYNSFEKIKFEDKDGNKKDFEKNIKKIVKHLDFPVGSFSSYPLFKLAQKAKNLGLKVVLSGEGADEVFGGYIRYLPVAREYLMRREYPSYKELFDKGHLFGDGLCAYARITRRSSDRSQIEKRMQPLFENYDPITAMQLFDFTYIMPSLLQMGDRMASMFGIENRCPFLDRRVVEFGLSLPPELKINGLETKYLLRNLARRKCIGGTEEEKRGLSIPWNKWNNIDGYDRTAYFNYLKQIWTFQQ